MPYPKDVYISHLENTTKKIDDLDILSSYIENYCIKGFTFGKQKSFCRNIKFDGCIPKFREYDDLDNLIENNF